MSAIRKVDDDSLAEAAEIIRNGGLVVVPTDTVYGVACDPFIAKAIDRIYEIKGRPRFKALQVLLSSIEELDALGLDLPVPLNRLAAAFLPGAFSPIAVAREDCALGTVQQTPSGARTQGIRIPNSALSLRVLKATGPLAASSANRSGGESAQTARRPRQPWVMPWICIWTAVRRRGMSPAPWWPPTRWHVTGSPSCARA